MKSNKYYKREVLKPVKYSFYIQGLLKSLEGAVKNPGASRKFVLPNTNASIRTNATAHKGPICHQTVFHLCWY